MGDSLRILWLKTGPLHPLDTGGKLRTYNMLREMRERHHITYLALCPPGTPEEIKNRAAEYSQEQIWVPWHEARKGSAAFFMELAGNLFSSLPYAISKYASPGMTESIRAAGRQGRFDLIVCDFLVPAVNLPAKGGDALAPPTLLFQHNFESLIWQRSFENTRGWLKKIYFRLQWQRMLAFERFASARVNAVVGVSEEDCRLMRAELGLTNVLGSVPTGVDTHYFQPGNTTPQPGTLVFLGSMDWMPNIDAVQWFAGEIWPLLKANVPEATLTIVGRKPPPAVRELAQRDPSILVTGTVADVRPHLTAAEVMIVPLRVGGGTRIKIFEAMATGIPVVSTRVGAEGLPVEHGRHIMLADAPAEFAARTAELLAQPELRRQIGGNGLTLVREHYSWASATEKFAAYCRQTAAQGSKSISQK